MASTKTNRRAGDAAARQINRSGKNNPAKNSHSRDDVQADLAAAILKSRDKGALAAALRRAALTKRARA